MTKKYLAYFTKFIPVNDFAVVVEIVTFLVLVVEVVATVVVVMVAFVVVV